MKNKIFKSSVGALFLCCTLLAFLSAGIFLPSHASAITISLDYAYSNWDPPLNANFGTVEIVNSSNVGEVDFHISGLTAGAGGPDTDLQWLYFNTKDEITGLEIALSSEFASLDYSFDSTDNLYKAGPGGYYDGRIDFGDGSPQVSDVWVTLRASGNIFYTDFIELSSPSPSGKGIFTVAAHLQSTDTPFTSEFVGGDGVINSVPEPPTMLLLGLAMIGLAGFGRKSVFKRK